jgi:DNA-binding XRE family transcriptional regulator
LVALSVNGRQSPVHVHTCVALAYHGPRPTPIHQVRHRDGNRTNNHADNLAWGLPVENAADREDHGNTARGVRNGNSKLTPDIVRQIREIRAMGVSQRHTAEMFDVSKHAVHCIEAGKTWRHVVVPQRGNREAAREAGRRAGAA